MPDERIGSHERVTAIVGGDPLSRHRKQKCCVKWCLRKTYFDVEGNFSSRFCPKHAPKRVKRQTVIVDQLTCTGQGIKGDHCCWLDGEVCEFLRENVDGRRYACGLRLEHDSWDGVIADPRYAAVGEVWVGVGQAFNYCQTFDPSLCCGRVD